MTTFSSNHSKERFLPISKSCFLLHSNDVCPRFRLSGVDSVKIKIKKSNFSFAFFLFLFLSLSPSQINLTAGLSAWNNTWWCWVSSEASSLSKWTDSSFSDCVHWSLWVAIEEWKPSWVFLCPYQEMKPTLISGQTSQDLYSFQWIRDRAVTR